MLRVICQRANLYHEYHDTAGQNYIYSGTTMTHNGDDLVCSYDVLSYPTCDGYEELILINSVDWMHSMIHSAVGIK